MQVPLQVLSLCPQQTHAYNLFECFSSAHFCAVTLHMFPSIWYKIVHGKAIKENNAGDIVCGK